MNNRNIEWYFVTVGNKTYQFKNGKLMWVIRH